MTYILNLNLKNSSKIVYSLSKFYGLGASLVFVMLNDLNIGLDCRVRDLNQENIIRIVKWIDKNKIMIESNLKQKIITDISRQKSLKTYKGLRHIYGLPVRGQRTKTNASFVIRNVNPNVNKIKSL